MYRAFSKMTEEQIKDKLAPQLIPEIEKFTDEIKERIVKFKTSPLMYQALGDELDEMPQCAKKIKQYGQFRNIPLIVIGRDPEYSIKVMVRQGMPEQQANKIEAVWQDLIKGQLSLSPNIQYIMASDSGHVVHAYNPEVIIKAIVSLLA